MKEGLASAYYTTKRVTNMLKIHALDAAVTSLNITGSDYDVFSLVYPFAARQVGVHRSEEPLHVGQSDVHLR